MLKALQPDRQTKLAGERKSEVRDNSKGRWEDCESCRFGEQGEKFQFRQVSFSSSQKHTERCTHLKRTVQRLWTRGTHLGNHYQDQKLEYFCQQGRPFSCPPESPLTSKITYSDIHHHRLFLPGFELHISGITQYELLCLQY